MQHIQMSLIQFSVGKTYTLGGEHCAITDETIISKYDMKSRDFHVDAARLHIEAANHDFQAANTLKPPPFAQRHPVLHEEFGKNTYLNLL